MQETHSVEAETKIHIKSVYSVHRGSWSKASSVVSQAHWRLSTIVLGNMGIWDAFKMRIEPLALGAGAPLTRMSCPVALPRKWVSGTIFSDGSQPGDLFNYHKSLARRFSSAPQFIKTIGPSTGIHLCKLPFMAHLTETGTFDGSWHLNSTVKLTNWKSCWSSPSPSLLPVKV